MRRSGSGARSGPSMRERILARQRGWALRAGLEVDGDDRLGSDEEALLAPPSAASRDELIALGWLARSGKPGALARLDASATILCNHLEPLRDADVPALLGALGLPAAPGTLRFGPGPEACQGADAWIEPASGRPVAVVARLAEPYGAGPRSGGHPLPDLSGSLGRALPGCRLLSLDLQARPDRFRRLDPGPLLSLLASWTRRLGPRGFRLALLWEDGPHVEARELAGEIDGMRLRVGGDAEWIALPWRCLRRRLRERGCYGTAYAESLAARYAWE